MKIDKARGIVALALVIGLTVAGLLLNTGTGIVCSAGIGIIASICPLGALETLLGAKSVNLHWITCAAVVLVLAIVFGKAFCSWGCPVPWLQRFFSGKKKTKGAEAGACRDIAPQDEGAHGAGAQGEQAVPANGQDAAAAAGIDVERLDKDIAASIGGRKGCVLGALGGKRDGLQVDGRHMVLVGALASAGIFGFPVFCLVCPVGLSFATLIGVWNLLQFNETSWGMLIFPAILVIEVVFLRKWCFKFCPIGALTSLISKLNRSFKPHVDEKRCLREQGRDCHVCVDACPELLDPHSSDIPECSKCHLCAQACPEQAISFPFLKKRKR